MGTEQIFSAWKIKRQDKQGGEGSRGGAEAVARKPGVLEWPDCGPFGSEVCRGSVVP